MDSSFIAAMIFILITSVIVLITTHRVKNKSNSLKNNNCVFDQELEELMTSNRFCYCYSHYNYNYDKFYKIMSIIIVIIIIVIIFFIIILFIIITKVVILYK